MFSTLSIPPIIVNPMPKPTPDPKPPKPDPPKPDPPKPEPEPTPQPRPQPYPVPYPIYVRPPTTTIITTPAPSTTDTAKPVDDVNSWTNPIVVLLTVLSAFILVVLLSVIFGILYRLFGSPPVAPQEKIIIARPGEL